MGVIQFALGAYEYGTGVRHFVSCPANTNKGHSVRAWHTRTFRLDIFVHMRKQFAQFSYILHGLYSNKDMDTK